MILRMHDAKERRRVRLPDGREATVTYVPPRTGKRVKLKLDHGPYVSFHMDELHPVEPDEAAP